MFGIEPSWKALRYLQQKPLRAARPAGTRRRPALSGLFLRKALSRTPQVTSFTLDKRKKQHRLSRDIDHVLHGTRWLLFHKVLAKSLQPCVQQALCEEAILGCRVMRGRGTPLVEAANADEFRSIIPRWVSHSSSLQPTENGVS